MEYKVVGTIESVPFILLCSPQIVLTLDCCLLCGMGRVRKIEIQESVEYLSGYADGSATFLALLDLLD